MSGGVLDRQEVIAVLADHMVGRHLAGGADGLMAAAYREKLTDALTGLAETRVGSVQVACTDMEGYARIHNEGFAAAVEQFGEVLADARQDLAPEASAGDLLTWLGDVLGAMRGGERNDAGLGLVTSDEQALGTCSPDPAPVVTDEAVAIVDRPMPTREQIAEAIRDHDAYGCGCCAFYDFDTYEDRAEAMAEKVLALLAGAADSSV